MMGIVLYPQPALVIYWILIELEHADKIQESGAIKCVMKANVLGR